MAHEEPQIKNIKLSLFVRNDNIQQIDKSRFISSKKINNFWVLTIKRKSKVKFIYFPPNFINITGIKAIRDIFVDLKLLLKSLNLSLKSIRKISIDNITASGKFKHRIEIPKTARNLASVYYVRSNPDIYPGLHLKISNLGSILLFSSGKYSIVGVKCMQSAKTIAAIALNAIKS